MLLRSFIHILDSITPPHLAESWDNVGFQIGDPNQEVIKALLCLEVTSSTLKEAQEKGAELILSHHPLLFHPLKQVVRQGSSLLAYQMIEQKISLYVAHTNLDVITGGVASYLAELLELKETRPLIPLEEEFADFTLLIPPSQAEILPLFEGKLEGFEVSHLRKWETLDSSVIFQGRIPLESWSSFSHFCQSMGLEITRLIGKEKSLQGLGRIGTLEKSITGRQLVQKLKKILPIHQLRYVGDPRKKIKNLALLPGSGGGYWERALQMGAQAFITGDIKHHTALDAEAKGLFLVDPGHYGSEAIVLESWAKLIQKTTKDVHLVISQISTDPFRFA
ncbi:MAG: Nif3-like dinuclear metal center hexameric protein [Planctomycetota bacterium]|nr:MAG: Nif3-like dinuclear metal center hexameric protein [Planctomycetota bacterium]